LTKRLRTGVQEIGFARLSAKAENVEVDKLGMGISDATLLWSLYLVPLGKVRVVGVDDWSWRRGKRFGTILVNLFLLVCVLYVISHLFERRSPVSHVCFEQAQPCLHRQSDAVRNPQQALCVWFSVRAQGLLYVCCKQMLKIVMDALVTGYCGSACRSRSGEREAVAGCTPGSRNGEPGSWRRLYRWHHVGCPSSNTGR